jgi:hypothetical protein
MNLIYCYSLSCYALSLVNTNDRRTYTDSRTVFSSCDAKHFLDEFIQQGHGVTCFASYRGTKITKFDAYRFRVTHDFHVFTNGFHVSILIRLVLLFHLNLMRGRAKAILIHHGDGAKREQTDVESYRKVVWAIFLNSSRIVPKLYDSILSCTKPTWRSVP